MTKILLVDDSPIDRVLVEGLLKSHSEFTTFIAKNGAEALAALSELQPDVVLTDMQMPEMDGLQLVTNLRVQYPHIPVILMTAHGSEHVAMQALEQGASSYVPKSQLSDKLVDTLQHIVAMAHADRSYARLTQSMDRAELRFHLPYDNTLFARLVELLGQMATSLGVCEVGGEIRLGMAVEEALNYMFYRGNYELNDEQLQQADLHRLEGNRLIEERQHEAPYANRKLVVECLVTSAAAEVKITHEGPALAIPSLPANDSAVELEAAVHRSLVILHTLLDEVSFSDDGRRVTLIKRREQA